MLIRMLPVDYNSWIESPQGLKLAAGLDKDVVLAEGMPSELPSHAHPPSTTSLP
jgi:hypothetical protein